MTGITSSIIHSGLLPDSLEGLDDLQALGELLALGFGGGLASSRRGAARRASSMSTFLSSSRIGFAAHAGGEGSSPFSSSSLVYFSSERSSPSSRPESCRIDDDVGFAVEDLLELLQRDVEQVADTRRQRLQEPDVRDRRGQVDVAEALTADLGLDDFDAALLADDAAVLHALVLAAVALVVLHRPEDLGAEEPSRSGLNVR